MKQILTTLLLLFSLTLSAQTVDVVGPKKKQQTTAIDNKKQQAEQQRKAAEAAEAKRQEQARKEQLRKQQVQRAEQARQEQLRQEQAQREEQARQEQLRREQAQREEQTRQEQLRREQAQREELARQERLRYGNGHDWVDLGLPSGIKWATCNIGADALDDFGDYFAWGETTTKSTYDWSTYFDSANKKGTKFFKYDTDKKTRLDLDDDAAHVNWGGNWRMPTKEEMDELFQYCTVETKELTKLVNHGTSRVFTNCLVFTSKINGNSIYLPYAGLKQEYKSPIFVKVQIHYWTSTLSSSKAAFDLNYYGAGRFYGYPIRPVCP